MKTSPTSYNRNNPSIIYEGASEFQLGTLDGNIINYDFQKIVNYIQVKGKLMFGKNFKVYQEDHELLLKLSSYFIKDYAYCAKFGIDPDKGLLLSGPVGCGKTTLMMLLPHLIPHKKRHTIIPARNIVFGFNAIGYKTIEDYSDSKEYCFDDLGAEHTGRHYGKDCNVMGEILISRYDQFKKKGIKTHCTTNLNAVEIEERYGERVRSRMRELFNLVSFNTNSVDKRG
ncbi:MAG: ATPase [Bizionia sp.]|nr:ATPase [Bizionia sp.]